MNDRTPADPESVRLLEDAARIRNWKRFGPYLSERQWATVREDTSVDGDVWNSFPHDQARSRAYRWGEDGLLGFSDRQCRLCFALALWNGRDPILKERLFGLTGPEGNHGEDVKEAYFFLDGTPTHSYSKALYKYPQAAFPYARLVDENRARSRAEPEFELADTGVFDDGRYFDVFAEYAKAAPEDLLIRITIHNRGPDAAPLHVLPTLWFRNTWSWGSEDGPRPTLRLETDTTILSSHAELGSHRLLVAPTADGAAPELLFTENETNRARVGDATGEHRPAKDAFDDYVVHGRADALATGSSGTKAAALYRLTLGAGEAHVIRLRLVASADAAGPLPDRAFDALIDERIAEAERFYRARIPAALSETEHQIARQAYAGLTWSQQFYQYPVADWLGGDPGRPVERRDARNRAWRHLYAHDVLSMPDTWEFPWFAAWDLAFHMLPVARIDATAAKHQLLLLLREWYMHPNGQLPAYEFAFGDTNPPVHAWACLRVHEITGGTDRVFLARAFQKLVMNFTWWVNRLDSTGNNLFEGGFLGLDNIGVFDRSAPLADGARLEQADATAWMAFYCGSMLAIALELAHDDPAAEDMASKFFEHFVGIADAINTHGGDGLWDEEDGFYYDQVQRDGETVPLRIRSIVGLIPLLAAGVMDDEAIARLPGFSKRMDWFLANRPELAQHMSWMCSLEHGGRCMRLLAIPSEERLRRLLERMLDEDEFLSPYGIRSMSKAHGEHPFELHSNGVVHRVGYEPGESSNEMFGGNSNWRGPIWMPINYLLVGALRRYDAYYGSAFRIECPTGSGTLRTLGEVADELSARLVRIFVPDAAGRRPCHGDDPRFRSDPHWRDLVLFHEHFHGDDGRGLGASHQTGWTALVATLLEEIAGLDE